MPSEAVRRIAETFQTNRQRFERFCRSLSDEELARPVPDSSWQVKDFISHLATLDTEITRWFEAVMAGDTSGPGQNTDGSAFDIDAWNEEAIQERKDWTLDQIFEEAAPNRRRMLETLARMTDENIEQIVHFSGDNKRDPTDVQFKLFLHGLARHDPIHVADMLKALPERAEDSETKEWLDDRAVQWYQNAMSGPPRR
jgi:uncharacterized damage-inducible protein DinB